MSAAREDSSCAAGLGSTCDNSCPPASPIEHRLRHRLIMEQALASASRLLICQKEPDTASVLRTVGEAAGVHRAYICELSGEGGDMRSTEEWCAPGVASRLDEVWDLSSWPLPWLMERLRAREAAIVRSVDDLPEAAAAEAGLLREQDVHSTLMAPLLGLGGEVLGFIGLDDLQRRRHWDEDDAQTLGVIAEMLVASWERLADRRAREEALAELKIAG